MVPKHSDRLDQVIADDDPYWKFYILFDPQHYQSHPDLPPLSNSSIVPCIEKLFGIFSHCYETNQEPNEALLMEAMKFGSPLVEKLDVYSEPLSELLRDCFNSAMQKLRIEKHIQERVKESTDTEKEHRRPGRPADRKIDRRRAIVRDYIRQKSDFHNKAKLKQLFQKFDEEEIPRPKNEMGLAHFAHPWMELLHKPSYLRERVITILNRDRWKR